MRRIKNCLRGAIVLLERHYLGGWPVPLKIQDVANICATPAVDRLVVITYHAEIAVFRSELPHPVVLDAVRVLVLINVQVLPLGAIAICNGRRLLQQAQPFEEQIIEVECVEALQLGGIATSKASDEALVMRDRAILHLLGGEAIVLRAADSTEDQARLRLARCGEVILFQEPLDDARLIVGVVDGEPLR